MYTFFSWISHHSFSSNFTQNVTSTNSTKKCTHSNFKLVFCIHSTVFNFFFFLSPVNFYFHNFVSKFSFPDTTTYIIILPKKCTSSICSSSFVIISQDQIHVSPQELFTNSEKYDTYVACFITHSRHNYFTF